MLFSRLYFYAYSFELHEAAVHLLLPKLGLGGPKLRCCIISGGRRRLCCFPLSASLLLVSALTSFVTSVYWLFSGHSGTSFAISANKHRSCWRMQMRLNGACLGRLGRHCHSSFVQTRRPSCSEAYFELRLSTLKADPRRRIKITDSFGRFLAATLLPKLVKCLLSVIFHELPPERLCSRGQRPARNRVPESVGVQSDESRPLRDDSWRKMWNLGDLIRQGVPCFIRVAGLGSGFRTLHQKRRVGVVQEGQLWLSL